MSRKSELVVGERNSDVPEFRMVQANRVQTSASVQPDLQDSVQIEATQVDADLASELIASGVTTQPAETVIAVLAATRDGVSINAAAKASGINYRTAQRIVEAATAHQQRQLAARLTGPGHCQTMEPPLHAASSGQNVKLSCWR